MNTPKIAILNSNADIIEGLAFSFANHGMLAVTGHVHEFRSGKKDIGRFLAEHDPKVVIFDIAPPYEENYRFFELVAESEDARGRAFVLTTTNKAVLEKFTQTDAVEIIGKPFDFQQIRDVVEQELARVETRKVRK